MARASVPAAVAPGWPLGPIRAFAARAWIASDPESGPSGAARRARLLVVDDDWLIAIQIEHHLRAAGYEIVGTAADAAQAVDLAGCLRPDLVLVDIRLRGGSDGVLAAREILERFGVRSLFVSAHADAHTRARADASRPLGWVPKPFTAPELLHAVETALAAR